MACLTYGTVSGQLLAASYAYNGVGDRLQQTANSVTTNYTLDLAVGLTQVLADSSHTYLYGNGRVAQYSAATTEYFLGDALGSVRQLVDGNVEVTLAKSYMPFGETLSSAGEGESAFAFTGEAVDSTGLTYLRARYYSPQQGRFTSRDVWEGDYYQPVSYNKWLYALASPVEHTDPSGLYID
jgi:RHS repeat-associated protein